MKIVGETMNTKESGTKLSEISETITASDCCKILSKALDEDFLRTRNKTEEETRDDEQNATNKFVSILSCSRHGRLVYLETIKSSDFQKKHARRLFSSIFPLLKLIFEHERYVPLSAFEEVEEDETDKERCSIDTNDSSNRNNADESSKKRNSNISQLSDFSIVPDRVSTESLQFIKYSAMIVQAFLNNQIQRRKTPTNNEKVFDIIEEVFEVAELLHNNLFSLNSCGKEGMITQKEIVNMCELYWQGRFTDSEILVTQLIPLLVVKSLNGNATKADIKRLWNLRESLHLLDFQEQGTISELRNLLLRTVSSPLYLKNIEGRKMIAFLFQLHPSLQRDLHHSIRAQISFSNSSILEAYGEIYFYSWKDINDSKDGDCFEDDIKITDDNILSANESSSNSAFLQSTIEDSLQDFMFRSIHATSPHMTKAILTFLEPFHAQKKNPDVDALLYRLYSPILWRALSAANPLVRINACTLLHCTFPLYDPNLGNAHLKEVNAKTIEVLLTLLKDDDPKVRIAGCNASIRILGVFWDALHSTHIRSLLNEIVMKHANDASSAMVRFQAVKGITLLLDAKASHGVLRPLLPLLGNRIHDSVERVRLSAVKMLLKLKGMKGFKYYHIVPSTHILARLAVEGTDPRKICGPVASAITELLVNSYFPKSEMGSEQTRRTLHFITQNYAASKVFYANLTKHLEINFCCKLIVMLFKTVKKAVENEKMKCDTKLSKTKQLNDMQVIASNVDLMVGIAETIMIMYKSISDELLREENDECLHFVQKSIEIEEVLSLCTYFEESVDIEQESQKQCERICSSLLSCVRFSSDQNATQICEFLESRVESIQDFDLLPYFAILCSWGKCDDVIFSWTNTLYTFLFKFQNQEMKNHPTSSARTLRKRKRHQSSQNKVKRDLTIPLISCKSTLFIIDQVLHGKKSDCIILRNLILSSEVACKEFEKLLEKTNSALQNLLKEGNCIKLSDQDIEEILFLHEILCKFIVHKSTTAEHQIKTALLMKDHLVWITDFATSVFLEEEGIIVTNSPFEGLNLSRISAIGSRPSDTKLHSPLQISPQERNSGSPPSDIDLSFLDMEKRGSSEFKIQADLSFSVRVSAICLSLLRTVFSLCGELALLEKEGLDAVIKLAKKWSQVMKRKTCIDGLGALFPSFCRFAILAGRATSNYDLIIEAIAVYDDTKVLQNYGQDILLKSINQILSYRGKNSEHTQDLVQCIVSSLPTLLERMKTNSSNFESIEKECPGLTTVIHAIIENGNGKFIPLLVQTLIHNTKKQTFSTIQQKVVTEILLLSCAKCSADVEREVRNIFLKMLDQKAMEEEEDEPLRDEKIDVLAEAMLFS